MSGGEHRYLLALGSNMRHQRHGAPSAVLRAALLMLEGPELRLIAASAPVSSAPVGPSRRHYANAVAVVVSSLPPPGMLARLQATERAFGRRRRGQRWQARVLDLDLILWSGGRWRSPGLVVPHPQFRQRVFVLGPAARVAPGWRDPVSGRTLAQLAARLTRRRPNPTPRNR